MVERGHGGTPPPADAPVAETRVGELERRIEELEGLDDAALGAFTALDWLFCGLLALLIPVVILLRFAR